MKQQCMFDRSEMDSLARSRRNLEWEILSDSEKHLAGRCQSLGLAVSMGARLTADARKEVAAAAALGLLGWLRQPSREALERLLDERLLDGS